MKLAGVCVWEGGGHLQGVTVAWELGGGRGGEEVLFGAQQSALVTISRW